MLGRYGTHNHHRSRKHGTRIQFASESDPQWLRMDWLVFFRSDEPLTVELPGQSAKSPLAPLSPKNSDEKIFHWDQTQSEFWGRGELEFLADVCQIQISLEQYWARAGPINWSSQN